MNVRLRFTSIVLTCLLWAGALGAGAQTVDASFQATDLYRPSSTNWVAQQADGKYLVVGGFVKSDTGPIGRIMRFNTDFTPDNAFNAVVAGLSGTITSVRVLPAGQLLVVGIRSLTLAGITRQDLLRLNDNGTPDASFDAGVASGTSSGVVVEPASNGQLLVGGWFTQYNGAAHSHLVRLTATGGIDATFTPPTFTSNVSRLVLQPDGKILVGCQTQGTGANQRGLVRLNANGTLDGSFAAVPDYVSGLALQPDGKVLVAGVNGFALTGYTKALIRLLPTGALDTSFQGFQGSSVGFFAFNTADERRILLQPDGRIIINGDFMPAPVRLNANGSVDPSFQTTLLPRTKVASLALTASGQVLVAGSRFELPGRRSQVVLLGTNGSLVAGFSPVLLTNGQVDAVAVQPNGMIVAGGSFDEANGTGANNLARFRTDGSVDASFVPPTGLYYIHQIILQPDGKILVAQTIRSGQPAIVRLLPTGALDASFQLTTPVNNLNKLLLQPDGRLLVLADTATNGLTATAMRLLANGRVDRTFTPAITPFFNAYDGALQPDGKLVLAANNTSVLTDSSVIRLLPNGRLDSAFSPVLDRDATLVTSVNLQSDGKILLVDNFYNRMRRLLPNGGFDATFTAYAPTSTSQFTSIYVQPNDRILLSGYPNFFVRLLPNGVLDASFTSPGINNWILDMCTTQSGQVVAGGYFISAGGQRRVGLVRLNAANVLSVADKQVSVTTEAWPNPCHGKLHLLLQANARPLHVVLLNALGNKALSQPVEQSELTLNTDKLVPGLYVLRVDYATGSVTRRIVLE